MVITVNRKADNLKARLWKNLLIDDITEDGGRGRGGGGGVPVINIAIKKRVFKIVGTGSFGSNLKVVVNTSS